jgi:hypothetical protein
MVPKNSSPSLMEPSFVPFFVNGAMVSVYSSTSSTSIPPNLGKAAVYRGFLKPGLELMFEFLSKFLVMRETNDFILSSGSGPSSFLS